MQRGLYVVLGGLAGYLLFGTYAAFGYAAIVVNLFTPLPAAYVGMRCGSRYAGFAVVVTLLLVLLTSDLNQALMFLVQFGLPGAALPWLLQRGIAWDRSALAVVWLMVVASIFGLVLYAASIGESPLALAGNLIDKEVAQTATVMQDMFAGSDLPADQQQEISQATESMANFLARAYPGIVITISGMMVLGLILMLSLLSRKRYDVPGTAFQNWKTPEPLVWFLILAGFTVAFIDGAPATFAINLLVILLPVYFLQGLAVIDCVFRRKAFSPVIRTIGYLLVTLINPLPMVVTGIGVFDLWADFRKPREPES